jgi:hypothetical protein
MSSDLALVKDQSSALPGQAWYISGILQLKTNLSLEIIIKYLITIYSDFEVYKIPPDQRESIESYLLEGKLGDSKNVLESCIENSKKSMVEVESDLVQMINDMKNDPLYNQKIEPRLESYSSFTCFICESSILNTDLCMLEDCPHVFHLKCISLNIKEQVLFKIPVISCPVGTCNKEIMVHHLHLYVDQEIIKEYQENSINDIINSGKLGKLVSCPNETCKTPYLAEGQTGNCHKCGISICGKCTKNADDCLCNPIVMKRACPACTAWVNKGKDKIVTCEQCESKFCFNCLKINGQCTCGRNYH